MRESNAQTASAALWHSVRVDAAALAQRLGELNWPDRARVVDEFLWSRAREALTPHEITAVVNRQHLSDDDADNVSNYRAYCVAVITAALAVLRKTLPVM